MPTSGEQHTTLHVNRSARASSQSKRDDGMYVGRKQELGSLTGGAGDQAHLKPGVGRRLGLGFLGNTQGGCACTTGVSSDNTMHPSGAGRMRAWQAGLRPLHHSCLRSERTRRGGCQLLQQGRLAAHASQSKARQQPWGHSLTFSVARRRTGLRWTPCKPLCSAWVEPSAE